MPKIPNYTREQQADILAQYLPDNACYQSAWDDGSVLRNILLGLASQWMGIRAFLNDTYDEWDPNTTTQFITEWEATVGIPDDCIPVASTLEQRRKNILLKLGGMDAETEAQYQNIANILGFSITLEKASDLTFPLKFPIVLINQDEAPFTLIIRVSGLTNIKSFPLKFPLDFSSNSSYVLECLLNKVKQSHIILRFIYS